LLLLLLLLKPTECTIVLLVDLIFGICDMCDLVSYNFQSYIILSKPKRICSNTLNIENYNQIPIFFNNRYHYVHLNVFIRRSLSSSVNSESKRLGSINIFRWYTSIFHTRTHARIQYVLYIGPYRVGIHPGLVETVPFLNMASLQYPGKVFGHD